MKSIAIYIPTHNRPHCLRRLLYWLRDSGLAVYIGDSSYENNKAIINDPYLKPLSIKYYYKNDWNIYEKWNYVTSKIKEKYTVTCAEDDFPAWQNFKNFYNQAEKQNAGCVVGRELTATKYNDSILFEESQEYRRWCIHNSDDRLTDFKRAHNPIVCTFYQFFRTDILCQVHAHWSSLKCFYPGNKMQEIIFRSSTFILTKVIFEDTILNIRTDEPTLRYSETTAEAKKFRLNFMAEYKSLRDNKQLESFLSAHSQLFLSSSRWNISKNHALDIVNFLIWKPMLSRMNTRHEILWKTRIKVLVHSALSQSQLCRETDSMLWKLPLERLNSSSCVSQPIEFANLDSFILRRPIDINLCMSISRILLA